MLFDTADLLSKWGLGDGDMLHDFKVEHDLKVNATTLLVEVVKRYVLPQLRRHHHIKATIVLGLHNPLRVTEVDGVSVDDEDDEPSITLTPATVEVADDLILAIANEPQLIAEWDEEDLAQAAALVDAGDLSQYGPLLDVLHRRLERQMNGLNGEGE